MSTPVETGQEPSLQPRSVAADAASSVQRASSEHHLDRNGSPGRSESSERPHEQMAVRATRSRWWVEVAAIVWLLWVYDTISDLAPLRQGAALAHARGILHLERILHLDPELTLNRWLAAHHTLGLVLSDYYDNAHFIVTIGLLAWLWWRRPDLYRPLRSSLVLINALGFVVFWLYPVAPPRMLAGMGFSDIVASTHAFGSWHTGSLASAANQLAAMPSLHMAWAVWSGLVLWRISQRPWVRALAVLHPVLTSFAVLSTGNHFLADVLAGMLTTALAVLLVGAWRRYRGHRTEGAASAAPSALSVSRVP